MSGCIVGAAWGCGVATIPRGVVAATADSLGLEVASERILVCDGDVQAAVNIPASNIALSVVCLITVIHV